MRKIKFYRYALLYLLIILVIGFLGYASREFVFDYLLEIKLYDNVLLFIIIDTLLILLVMRNIKKVPYRIGLRILNYFKYLNNLVLFIVMFISGTKLSICIINIIINVVLITFLSPRITNPEDGKALSDYFNGDGVKRNKLYKDKREVEEEYNPLKKELDVEIPALKVIEKDEKRDKRRRVVISVIGVVVLFVLIFGIFFSCIEDRKVFNRGYYNLFSIYLNDEEILINYEEQYYVNVIPFIYEMNESRIFNEGVDSSNLVIKEDKNYLTLKEYECLNNDKGNNVRVSCGSDALNETPSEVTPNTSNMVIELEEEKIYDGKFVSDITPYLKDDGTYYFTITNKRDHVTTVIDFSLVINELE